GNLEGQTNGPQSAGIIISKKGKFGAEPDFGKAGVRLEVRRPVMWLTPDLAELIYDQGPPLGKRNACLRAEKFDVAAVIDWVPRRRGIVYKDRPNLGQGTRVFK